MLRRTLRNLCVRWSPGRSPVMVTLVTCVIVLQTFILVRMGDGSNNPNPQTALRDLKRVGRASFSERKETSTKANSGGMDYFPSSRTLQSSDSESKSPFDLKSCSCGLHFSVQPKVALLVPIPNITKKKFLTIGIPTVTRRNDSYIIETVTSLLSNMDAVQQNEVVLVIMIADFDPAKRNFTFRQLQDNYSQAIKAENVHVIAPPADLYTNFKVTKQTYGQDYSYVEWRSKQNFYYTYLMRYSAPLAMYYMQIEDDDIVARNYVAGIRQYVDEQKDAWTCLEFSELGFIGKLFRSKDLDRLSQLLIMFFQEQPVDYTYFYFNMLIPSSRKGSESPPCSSSSFPGKIQPLKDRFFDKLEKRYNGDNPMAEVYTTLKTYLNFLPRLPYCRAEGYFWTDGALSERDTFILAFETPQTLERVIIDTGSESHPTDILENAALKASLTLVRNPLHLGCINDIDLGTFVKGQIDVKGISSLIKFKVVCLQIQVLKTNFVGHHSRNRRVCD